jgi:hypothetical protein
MKILLVALALGCVNQVKAQTASNVKTTGACSAVVVGNHNSVTCEAMTKDEAKKMAAILSEVRTSNVSLDVILGKLDAILAQIRRNGNPNIGLISYDPDGRMRKSAAGSITRDEGETEAYHQMLIYDNENRFQEEADLAEKEKVKQPDWLTPILFAGTAYADLCRISDAAAHWNEFIEKASAQPIYKEAVAEAKDHLSKLPLIAASCPHP